ncbi:MAG: radical SAM protein [Deltaproteobacteria bacterium]|nr:radical SAM protein [Deltaproteobacteria bacterium]
MTTGLPEILPRVPVTCFFEITDACNLRCVHCWAAAGERAPDELGTDEALDAIAQVATAGCRTLRLTGGEPLTRPDWPLLARRASDLGLEVSIITNGTLVDEAVVSRMCEAGVANVRVSLDGEKDVHDAIRVPAHSGLGSVHDRAIRALMLARAAGLKTAVITQIHKRNLTSLAAIHDTVAATGADEWQVQIAMPMGRMLLLRYEYLIEPRDLPRLEADLAALADRGAMRIAVTDNIGYYGRLEPRIRGARSGKPIFFAGCTAGCRVVAIRSNGEVKGCPSHPAPFVVGSLRVERFADIWGDRSRFAYNTAFEAENLQGGCRECTFRRVCRAGCRSMAFAVTGTIYDNPFCMQRVHAAEAK